MIAATLNPVLGSTPVPLKLKAAGNLVLVTPRFASCIAWTPSANPSRGTVLRSVESSATNVTPLRCSISLDIATYPGQPIFQ